MHEQLKPYLVDLRAFPRKGSYPGSGQLHKAVGSKRSDDICHTVHNDKVSEGDQSQAHREWLSSLAGAAWGPGDTQERGTRSVVTATHRRTIFPAATFP